MIHAAIFNNKFISEIAIKFTDKMTCISCNNGNFCEDVWLLRQNEKVTHHDDFNLKATVVYNATQLNKQLIIFGSDFINNVRWLSAI